MARTHLARRGDKRRGWIAVQIGIGLVLLALGVAADRQRRASARRRRPRRDYSGRSGFPLGLETSRGAASDAPIPADMLTPELLRPYPAAV